MLSPTPINPQNLFGDFQSFIPKKPRDYAYPHPQKISEISPMLVPVPEISGRGRGKPGIGAPIPHTSFQHKMLLNNTQN